MRPELSTQPLKKGQIGSFLRLTAKEGWISTQEELEFFLRSFPLGCLTVVADKEPVAFITSIRYCRSAWIGNLLVSENYRGQGIGRMLMQSILELLDDSGCDTVWLTASSQGAGLYRELGFKEIDIIRRWVGNGRPEKLPSPGQPVVHAAMLDSLGWGDSRSELFADDSDSFDWLIKQDGFLRHTAVNSSTHVGPWSALSSMAASKLFSRFMKSCRGEGSIYLDSPENNISAKILLRKYNFSPAGSNLLMYRGMRPRYRPDLVYSLASLGSYG